VLESSVERIIVDTRFADIPLGLYVIRGENIVLVGPVDEERDRSQTMLTQVDVNEILAAKKQEEENTRLKAELSKQLRVDWFKDDDLF